MLIPTLAIFVLLAAPSPVDLATASPDAPALELSWRDGLRAKAGGRLRFVGDGDDRRGPLFEFLGFIELHNQAGNLSFVPYQFWRGRFAFEAGYRWTFEGEKPWTFRLVGALEHESDHATAPNSGTRADHAGFVNLNSLSATAGLRHGRSAPTHAALTVRLHALTCTFSQLECGRGGGLAGDRSVEAELAFTQELPLWGALQRWNLFASAWGDAVAGTRQIVASRRLGLRAGTVFRRKSTAVSLSVHALVGTDIGYFQQREAVQLGVGVAWVAD